MLYIKKKNECNPTSNIPHLETVCINVIMKALGTGKFRDKSPNCGETGNCPEGSVSIVDEPAHITGANQGRAAV